jgi:hypothetical protein
VAAIKPEASKSEPPSTPKTKQQRQNHGGNPTPSTEKTIEQCVIKMNLNINNNVAESELKVYNESILQRMLCEVSEFCDAPVGIKPNLTINTDNRHQYLESSVINLSDLELSDDTLSALSKGLTFSPSPGEPIVRDIMDDLSSFFRRLRIKAFFNDDVIEEGLEESLSSNTPNELNDKSDQTHNAFVRVQRKFYKKSSWQPPTIDGVLEGFIRRVKSEVLENIKPRIPNKKNLSRSELEGLTKLRENPHIIIKKADKGSAVAVMNTVDYIREVYRQLSDTDSYEQLDHNPTETYNLEINT